MRPRWTGLQLEHAQRKLQHLLGYEPLALKPCKRYNPWTGTSPQISLEAERSLLEDINYQSLQVNISPREYINTIKINEGKPKNLVMNHGYGAGLGFYFKNYNDLSQLDYNIYSFDWLGMANSSRPKFIRSTKDDEKDVENAEDFFIDSLEIWRKEMGLEKITLLGHSLGGYLSTCYALKYPERVEKLILVSPAGIPAAPSPTKEEIRKQGYLLRMFRHMWNLNMTPMWIMRTLGPLGSNLLQSYTTRRFAHLEPYEIKQLDRYIYHISAQKGSGEYSLARLLLPGANARHPLWYRLPKLNIPVTFVYGDRDWMDFRHAARLMPYLRDDAELIIVRNAGHHLYFDNHEAFNHAIMGELQQLPSHPDVVYLKDQLKN